MFWSQSAEARHIAGPDRDDTCYLFICQVEIGVRTRADFVPDSTTSINSVAGCARAVVQLLAKEVFVPGTTTGQKRDGDNEPS